MEEAARVRIGERFADLGADTQHVRDRQRAAGEPRLERAAGHVLHHQEVGARLRVEVEDGGDAGMREPRQHVGLAAEALARRAVVERARGEHLDRDLAIEVRVVRLPHLAHAAAPDLLDEAVAREVRPR